MSKFKINDEVCWRSTGQRVKVLDINTEGKMLVSAGSQIYWKPFFFDHVIEPNMIMKEITNMKLYFALTNEGIRECPAKAPTKAYETDAGYDLYCTNSLFINTNQIVKIPTGVIAAIPPGHYGKVSDRSSMGLKGAKCLAGVIDSAYRGEISVLMTNLSKDTILINAGDKIAQLIIHKLYEGNMEVVDVTDLPSGERNSNGFGSSGV